MIGVLLLNVGSPDSPDPEAVRAYLSEFLMDPCVLDMPTPLRWLLVHGIILRKRPEQSAEKYAQIWEPEGSPLVRHTRDLARAVQAELGDAFVVDSAMRYGKPSLIPVMRQMIERGVTRFVMAPLFPQESRATTQSALIDVDKAVKALSLTTPPAIVRPFHQDRGFIEASADAIRAANADPLDEYLLFSFHGLPRYQVKKADARKACLRTESCCDVFSQGNAGCYRAQCIRTAHVIAEELKWPRDNWGLAFQSRIGRGWIGPDTEATIKELARAGKRRVVVACPSFVADCLETLEEIGIRGAEQFKEAGGETLRLAPALNSRPAWARTVARLVRSAAQTTAVRTPTS